MGLLVYTLLLLSQFTAIQSDTGDCGIRESKWDHAKIRHRRIIGGNEVPVGKYPWHVQINATFRHSGSDDTYISSLCGGSIIAERWILSAAHCFVGIVNLTSVTFGSVQTGEISEYKIALPKRYIIHEGYDKNDFYGHNDIGLVELHEAIPFDHTASPVCLPSTETVIPEEAQVIATGIGYANDRIHRNTTVSTPNVLETVLPLIPNDICGKRLNETLAVTHICGGSYGHGAGPGDSGGPAVLYSKSGRWFQVGVVSGAMGKYPEVDLKDLYPGKYTNVKEYCDWIEENTGGEVECQDAELIDATALP